MYLLITLLPPRMELKKGLTCFIVILGPFERIIENVLLSKPILRLKHHVLYFSSCISNCDQNSSQTMLQNHYLSELYVGVMIKVIDDMIWHSSSMIKPFITA